eukprot:81750_1
MGLTYGTLFAPDPLGNGISFAIGAVLFACLFTYHMRQICSSTGKQNFKFSCTQYSCNQCQKKKISGPNRQERLLFWLQIHSIIVPISYMISLTSGSILFLNDWNVTKYPNTTRWGLVSILLKLLVLGYDTAKASLYYAFVMRIEIAFYKSTYEYPKILMYILKCLAICFILVMGTCDIFFSFATYEVISISNNSNFNYAVGYTETHFVTFQLIFDPLFSALTMYLFIKPLYKLSIRSHINTKNEKQNENVIYTIQLMIRYAILTAIAMLSSAILIALIVFGGFGGEFIPLDNILNCYCLFLMSSNYIKHYQFICGCCQKCITYTCFTSQNERSLAMNMPTTAKSKEIIVSDITPARTVLPSNTVSCSSGSE